jgi:signal transduction histidine kinase
VASLPLSAEPSDLGPWREQVMRRMLNAASVVAPLLVAITLLLGAERRSGRDLGVLLAAGFLPAFVRSLPGVSARARASAMVALILTCSLYLLTRLGFVAGLAVTLLACTVLAAVYLGRQGGLAFLAITAAAILAIGVGVTRGRFSIVMAETDPARLRNWIRMAVTTSLTGGIITMVVDLVIRHAEQAAGAAASALSRLRLAYRRLEHLHARLDAAKEQERSVLSGELREGLAQTLTALKLRLQIDASGAVNGVGDPALVETVSTVDQLIGLVRRMSGDLRPPLLEEVGLARALRAYLDEQAALSGLTIELGAETVATGERLPAELEIACFRVVQESMTNVLRHAAARRVRVRLARTADAVSISVEDDGHGFDPGAKRGSRDRRHLGLVGMRERARARGGTFELRSRPGAGTTIEVSLPISSDGAEGALLAAGVSPPSPALDERSDLSAIGAWRTNLRNGMLTVAAFVTPLLAILGLCVGGAHRDAIDVAVLATVGLLMPLLRIASGVPLLVRVHVALTALFAGGVYVLAVAGTSTGVSTVLICTSLTAVICLRRGIGFAFLGASFLAHIAVGLMVRHGVVHLAAAEVDPRQLQHWVRLATMTVLLGVWLTVLVDFVIRHVEANGRAAIGTLAELQVAYTRLGELHGRLEATREEERRFLAHELHDELGQTLTAIKLRLLFEGRRAKSSAPVVPAAPYPEALALVDQLIFLVRRISAGLRPPLLDEVGLYPAVRAFVEAQAAASGTMIELRAAPEAAVPRLGPDLEILGFRVVQEAVANALRHAAARRIVVEVSGDGAVGVRLAVRDDGRGFDPASLERSDAGGRLGVVGMRERVRSVGGTFELISAPWAGTTVEVALSSAARPRVDSGPISERPERTAASVSP